MSDKSPSNRLKAAHRIAVQRDGFALSLREFARQCAKDPRIDPQLRAAAQEWLERKSKKTPTTTSSKSTTSTPKMASSKAGKKVAA